MPGRVNTKFVLVLVTAIAAVAVVLGAVYYFQIRRNPTLLARKGDVYLQEGEYRLAIENYRRAALRAGNDVTYWSKLIDVLLIAPTEHHTAAQGNFQLLLGAARQRAHVAITDDQAQRDYYQLMVDLAEQLNFGNLYQQLYTDTHTRLNGQPQYLLGRRFRGIARTHLLIDRGDQFDLAREDQLSAQRDLVAVLDAQSDDADALYHLALWTLFDSRYLRRTNNPLQEVQNRRVEAVSLSRRMLELSPEDPQRMARHARVLLTAAEDIVRDATPDTAQDRALRDEAADLTDRLEASLVQSDFKRPDAVQLVTQAARLLQVTDDEQVDLPQAPPAAAAADASQDPSVAQVLASAPSQIRRGILRAIDLYGVALSRQPDTIDYLVQRGALLVAIGRQDEALADFELARKPGRSFPAVEMLRTQNQQVAATVQIGNLLIARTAESNDPAQRQAMMDRVRGLIGEIEPVYGRIPALDLLEGKLKLINNEQAAALQLFDKAARATGETDLEAMRLAAAVARRLGDWGDAARRLELILADNPANVQTRLELVEIYTNGRRYDQATRLIQPLLAEHAQLPLVQLLHANLLAQTGQVDQAIAIYESQDAAANPQIDLNLTRLYLMAQRPDDARRVMERRFDADPTDVRTLQALLRLSADDAQRRGYLDHAAQAGVEPTTLTVIERQMSDQQITLEELDELLPRMESDPFRLAMTQAQAMIASDKLDEADAKLAEAAALKPDDPQLIELRFGLALRREDWATAELLVNRAKAMNLDLADGAFFRGRLAEARGRFEEAAAELEGAMNQRPIFSAGWRMLGDVRAKLNRLQPAIDAYRRALEQQPNDPTTLDHLAIVQLKANQPDEALRSSREAWQSQPNNLGLMERYLELERVQGDPETALKLREQLAQMQPDNADHQRNLIRLMHERDRRQEAMASLESLIASQGLTRPNAALKAELLLREGRADVGEQVLVEYVASLGDKPQGTDYALLGQYRFERGDVAGGVEAYNEARQRDDSPTMTYTRMLGDQLFVRGINEEASQMYRQILDRTPDDQTVILRQAETLIRLQRYDEAQALLSGREPTEPQDLATWYVLRSILTLPGGKNPQAPENGDALAEALRLVNLALQHNESNAVAYTRRAGLLAGDSQRSAGVIADLNHAIELNPGLTDARTMLVEIYLRRNNVPEASRELRQMLRVQPHNRQARMMLINLYAGGGDRTSAAALIDEAIALEPNEALWAGLRAQYAFKAGNVAEGLAQLKRQMQLRPEAATVAQYVTALLNARPPQPAAALEVLREQAGLVNSEPVLTAVRARALAMNGQKKESEQLFVNSLSQATSMNAVSAVLSQMLLVHTSAETTGLLRRVEGISQPLWLEAAVGSMMARDQQYEQAIAHLEPLAGKLTDDAQARPFCLRELAQAYHQVRRFDEAYRTYNDLLAIAPEDAGTLNNMAYLLVEDLDRVEEGMAMAEKAARLMPDNGAVLDTLGWAQYKSGRLDEARQTLENALARQPLAATCVHLGQVYMDLDLDSLAREMVGRGSQLADETQDDASRAKARQLLELLDAKPTP